LELTSIEARHPHIIVNDCYAHRNKQVIVE